MTKKPAAKAKAIDPRDAIITDLQKKIEVLIDRLMHLERNEKAACSTPRPNLSAGMMVNENTLIVDNDGRTWWINPSLQEIRPA